LAIAALSHVWALDTSHLACLLLLLLFIPLPAPAADDDVVPAASPAW
jgi:hypothetical protein